MIVTIMIRTIRTMIMMTNETSDDNSVTHVESDDANENVTDAD